MLTSPPTSPELCLCLAGSVLKGASKVPSMRALWTLMTLVFSYMTELQHAAAGSSSCRRSQSVALDRSKTCSM